ncbi:hypothetical protein LTR37_011403 [Vermiconidia calcicola]|uniref:Uncharacterized protein n=1 Tax=Vermiconidia calcicola TaxID=1690605 RepID=A0ACC3N2C6_9PEZI|nr:hypothetical protein LTR37_011403 [Vermiconidia calcicola]
MASATERVFGIPELLEEILVDVSAGDHFKEGRLPRAQLFALQRVNQTFKAMVQDTPKLRRIMGLDCWPGISNSDQAHHWQWMTPYLKYEYLSIQPFQLEADIIHGVQFTFDFRDGHQARRGHDSMGMRGRSHGDVYGSAVSSWRKIKLFSLNIPVKVEVEVHNVKPLSWSSPTTEGHVYAYTRRFRLEKETATLGDLVDLLEKVARTSVAEHVFRKTTTQ